MLVSKIKLIKNDWKSRDLFSGIMVVMRQNHLAMRLNLTTTVQLEVFVGRIYLWWEKPIIFDWHLWKGRDTSLTAMSTAWSMFGFFPQYFAQRHEIKPINWLRIIHFLENFPKIFTNLNRTLNLSAFFSLNRSYFLEILFYFLNSLPNSQSTVTFRTPSHCFPLELFFSIDTLSKKWIFSPFHCIIYQLSPKIYYFFDTLFKHLIFF